MPSYNHVSLMGNLLKDAEFFSKSDRTPMCEFGMAVNTKVGADKEETVFIRVKCWGGWAEHASKMVKGQTVFVSGRLATEEWDGQNGEKQRRTCVYADKVFEIPRSERSERGGESRRTERQRRRSDPQEDDLYA